MKPRHVEIELKDSPLTVAQVVSAMIIIQKMHPDKEVFIDGDLYAIVSQDRKVKG